MAVRITEFTDPGCPWAWSAEPFRRKLDWLYGDALEWRPTMVVLSESPEDYVARGFTTQMLAANYVRISAEHRMPFDTGERPRMTATLPACRAVVAARLHAPDAARPLLRALRVRNFGGDLLDEPATIDGAARDAGLDPAALRQWTAGEDVEAAVREDMARAREPMPAARVLDHKLAGWSGGRRYTCPSYEALRHIDDVRMVVPGFQPWAVYDVTLANLVPGLDRRDPPDSVEEVLAWAGEPLATQEVAMVCGLGFDEARERLAGVAVEHPLGTDAFWSLPR